MAVDAKDTKTAEERGTRRVEVGVVLSDKRSKTITVAVSHKVKHPQYGKYLNRTTHLHAHDEKNEARTGDRVEVIETRPLSKQKRWRLVKIVERAAVLGSLDIKDVETEIKKDAKPAAPKTEGEAK